MKIVYYRYIQTAVVTADELGNEIRVEDDEGRPFKASVVIGNNYFTVPGTLRIDKPVEGNVSLIIHNDRYDLGEVVVGGKFYQIDNTKRINEFIKTLNDICCSLLEKEERIRNLETSAYGVDILELTEE